MAEELKKQGNAAFQAGDFTKAVQLFTDAIQLDPANHVLYSNRSGAYASLKQFNQALKDAEKTIELKADWPKGYSRKATALQFLGKFEDAVQVYEQGLKVDPNNESLKQGLRDVEAQLADLSGAGAGGDAAGMGAFLKLFSSPDSLAKLAMNPQTAKYLSQPDFLQILNDLKANPKNLSKHIQDARVMQAVGVLLGINPGDGADANFDSSDASHMETDGNHDGHSHDHGHGHSHASPSSSSSSSSSSSKKTPEKKVEEVVDDSEEGKRKREAEKEKDLGNGFYKTKEFEKAIAHYDKASELDPNNMVYLTNKSAVYFEMGDYEKCLEICHKAVEIGRENRADYKNISKALARIGNSYYKQGNLDQSLTYFNKSLAEHRTPDVVEKKLKVEKEIEEKKKLAYINPQISAEEREKGNEFFKKNDYASAMKHYNEAIKRNPNDAKLYSNRSACYTKLMEFNLALKDAEECIRLDPNFHKGYSRKGAALFARKDYAGAMEAYDTMGKLDDPVAKKEAQEGIQKCSMAMTQASFGGSDSDGKSEEQRVQEAMKDPEVQQIMADPIMRQILEQMSSDPAAIQVHLKNPEVSRKFNKLVSAGIVRLGRR